jgi:WD40 repeat protein
VWAGTESVIIVYDSKTCARQMTLKGHTRVVNCIKSVDDKHVWSCSTDQSVCVWTRDGQLVEQLHRNAPVLWLVAIERHVWAALRDGSIHIFDKNVSTHFM